jgi:hypothetical protein
MVQSNFVDLDTSKSTLQNVVQKILNSGKITAAERLWFHRMVSADVTLDAEMMGKVRLVFDRLKMGLIKVVD